MAADLAAENAQLEEQIRALKGKLGIQVDNEADQRARALKVFQAFDKDGNGTIDRSEFELLAFQAGANVNLLTPERQAIEFALIDTDGSGSISFEEFYAWLQGAAGQNVGRDDFSKDMMLLRMKLQSKSWFRQFSDAAAAKNNEAGQQQQQQGGARVAAALADADAVDNEFKFRLAVGQVAADEGSAITIRHWNDAALSQDLAQSIGCPPEAGNTFLLIDIALQPDFDEDQVAELVGSLDLAMAAIPWGLLPEQLQFYHSHAVDITEAEDGTPILRAGLFSKIPAEQLFVNMAALNPAAQGIPVPLGLTDTPYKTDFKLALPLGVDDIFDSQKLFDTDMLRAEIEVNAWVDRKLLAAKVNQVADHPLAHLGAVFTGAIAEFVQGSNVTFEFASVKELVDSFPDNAEMSGWAAKAVAQARQLQGQAVFGMVPMLASMSMGKFAPLVAPYMAGLKQLLGIRQVQLILGNSHGAVGFRGLDVLPHLVQAIESDQAAFGEQ